MALVIKDETLQQLNLDESEVLIELAVTLYVQGKLSSGRARKLCNLDVIAFQQELSKRNFNINYTVEDLNADVENLKSIGLL